MNYKVLYRKYRPANFDSLIGQNYSKQMLLNIINNDKIGHAYIFTGPRGTGKTSSAKLFAKAINCIEPNNGNPCDSCVNCINFKDTPDIIEIDAASNNGVDEIRNLIDNVKLAPSLLKYKVYIIDEVHMLTTSAFNALLLTLEEPPSHVVFILATTDIQNVPITILSRCQRFDFRPIDNDSIIKRLKHVCELEKINITDDALKEIAYISSGGMRDALSMLDQLSSNKLIDLDVVITNFGTISTEKIVNLVDLVSNNNLNDILKFLNGVKNKGVYYSVFLEKVISELRNRAILIKNGDVDGDFDVFYNLIFDLNECLSKTNVNINPYTLIEMIFLKYITVSTFKVEKKDECVLETVNKDEVITNTLKNDEISEKIVIDSNVREDDLVVDNTDVINTVNHNEVIVEEENEAVHDDAVDKVLVTNNDDAVISAVDGNDLEDITDNLKKIRINNCFVGVSKVEKEKFTGLLNELIDYLNLNDRYLMSLLADCSVVAASDSYILLSSSVETTNTLINKVLKKIEDIISKQFNSDVRVLALSTIEWNLAKEDYIGRTKSGVKYTLIEEVFEDDIMEESDELEKLALEIFGSDNIQFD